MRKCSSCERHLLGELCWAWAVRPQDQNTENKCCRRGDMSVLRTALHKAFHSLGEGRHVPRADNERRVLQLEAVLSGSWHWEFWPVSCLWSSAGGTVSLLLGDRSPWHCLCTALTPLMHKLLTFPRLLTRQNRDGNMTGFIQPSQTEVAALQVGEKITED